MSLMKREKVRGFWCPEQFADTPRVDQHATEFGIRRDDLLILTIHCGDETASATKQDVSDFDHSQVRPCFRSPVHDLFNDSMSGQVRPSLCKEQDHCSRRTGQSGMAMHEKACPIRLVRRQCSTEAKHTLDVGLSRPHQPFPFMNDIVKAQLEPLVLAE